MYYICMFLYQYVNKHAYLQVVANRRISELQEQAGLQLAEDDLLTVVNVSEPDPGLKNKKLTISGTKAYLNIHYLPSSLQF